MQNVFIEEAIKYFGSQANMAKALNVSSMRVYQWRKRGVPVKWAVAIEKKTGGEIPKHRLRPDIFGEAA